MINFLHDYNAFLIELCILHILMRTASEARLGPKVLIVLPGVSSPLHVSVLNDLIDLPQFRLSEHNITTCRILKGTFGMPGGYTINNVRKHITEIWTYDDPGSGMTCGPREPTQAIESCAGVIFFFLASSVKVSTIAKLCLRF